MTYRALAAALLALAVVATPARIEAADAPNATLASGATIASLDGWAQADVPGGTRFTAPEGDAAIVVSTVTTASAREAVDRAWTTYRADAEPAIRALLPRPPRNGWDEAQAVDYTLDPVQHRVVQTLALRKGDGWTVLLIDGTQATIEKRGAAVALAIQSLRAPGFVRETFAGRSARPLDAARVATIRQFVMQGMEKLRIPGAGLALYDHGRVVFEGGIGRRRVDSAVPVDLHTRFMIASNTKQMTTMLLATLVDEGRLRWDEPVTEAYPGFRLGDAATTAKVQIRHLICACTGVPRKDLEIAFATRRDTPPSQTFALLAATQPTSAFGQVYQYSNVMAAAAGFVGAHVAYPGLREDAGYDRVMQERIFTPIGMADTSFDYDDVLKGNHATPHGWDLAGQQRAGDPTLEYAVRPGRPAGGAWSSAYDMIRYAAVELNAGRLADGRQLASRANVLARRAPRVAMGEDTAYGMGLIVDRSSGVTAIHHGGSLPGFMSDMIELPDAGVAAVLLTNADSGLYLLKPFLRRLLEVVYDGRPEAQADVDAAAAKDASDRTTQRAALVVPVPGEARMKLATRYTSPDLGEIRVGSDAGGLTFDFGLWRSHVALRRGAGAAFVPIDPLALPLPFVLAERDGQTVLIVRDGQHEYVYRPAA